MSKPTYLLQLIRFDKPIGTLLLLWPTVMALIATHAFQSHKLVSIIFLIGVFVMRSAGCVINDIVDRNLDIHVARTSNRPLAQNNISLESAIWLFFGLICIAFVLALMLSFNTLLLSVGALALTIIYPFCKRFTFYPQVILGMAFAWSVPMVFMEVVGYLDISSLMLYIAVVLWVVAFDTEYALADKHDDIRIGIKSTALAFANDASSIIFILQLASLLLFALMGYQLGVGHKFWIFMFLAFITYCYQQYLLNFDDAMHSILAFKNNNLSGFILTLGLYYG